MSECDPDVYKYGQNLGFMPDGLTAAEADKFCQEQSEKTGWKYDWHSAMGHKVIKCLKPGDIKIKVRREPTDEMLDAGLSMIYGSPFWKKGYEPIGEFLSGATADESEKHNIASYGRERLKQAFMTMIKLGEVE